METLLNFFSDLILFTAGLGVVVFWMVILMVIAIEIVDLFKDNNESKVEEL